MVRDRQEILRYIQEVARGTIRAKNRVVVLPQSRLKGGRYVFAILMQATMNPARTTLVVSRPFRVR